MEDGLETAGSGNYRNHVRTDGQPQNGMPFIHVAGTNGKGSVCAFLTSVFREAGLKVGTFISPHLIDFEERIMVDGRQISREDVTRIGNVLLEQEFGVTPTMFDYCVLMAVLYFKEQNCDLVIMETGLGGRLDSTNALGNPVVSVITRIGYDHMNILGNTIEEIAQEKAGIIKARVPVVIAPQESEALAVLQRAAAAKGVRARCVQEKDLQGAKALQPGLLGAYQRENAATAMCAAQVAWTGCRIEKEKMKTVIARGIHRAVWPGRMEILSTEPFLMVDGAHNSNGIHALRTSLEELYPEEKFHFVMGVMADKIMKDDRGTVADCHGFCNRHTRECTGTARGNTGRRYQKTRGACTRNYKGCRDSGTFNTKRKDDCAGVFVFYRGIKKRISE